MQQSQCGLFVIIFEDRTFRIKSGLIKVPFDKECIDIHHCTHTREKTPHVQSTFKSVYETCLSKHPCVANHDHVRLMYIDYVHILFGVNVFIRTYHKGEVFRLYIIILMCMTE